MVRAMATGGPPVERLRGYLRELPPATRALLIAELERSLLRGDDVPGGDLLLQEVRSAVRESGQHAPRIGSAARFFFRPLEPFLIDDDPGHKHQARVARNALQPIWEWICRDVMPEEAECFSETVGHALLCNDIATCDQLSGPFQDQVSRRIRSMLAQVRSDQKAHRRLVGQVGTPAAIENLHDLLAILAVRQTLASLSSRLPGHIQNLAEAQCEEIKAMLDPCASRRDELLCYALVLVMGRLASPWQLVRLAVRAADSDDASRVAGTPYGVAVNIILADIARMVRELKADLRGGGSMAVTSLLKCIHDAVRGVRSELDLALDSPWSRQLAAIRSEVSGALKTEIESIPDRVRCLLRPRLPDKMSLADGLDPDDVAETEGLIELLRACRHYAGELAVSEMTRRTHSELQQYLDTGTQLLLDGLRGGEPAERPFRLSQLDAAVRFCAKVFGAEYAALLGKAAEVAANNERKAAARI
jgi:hypothetical protein